MADVCFGLILCLRGIYCIASLSHQIEGEVGRSTSLIANQKREDCLLKPPGDDIHTLYHSVDNVAAMRSERASNFPCFKIISSNITWHLLTFDRCSVFTHSAHQSHPAQRNMILGSSVCADELQLSHYPTTPPPYHTTTPRHVTLPPTTTASPPPPQHHHPTITIPPPPHLPPLPLTIFCSL